jgi:DNA-binding GntR family transcriptional regulator
MSEPKPIQRISLVDQVATRLREQILRGVLSPGRKIPVARLSRELEVSPIPIREALRQLEAESLVHTVPNSGPVVAEVRLDELHELYDLRRVIEGHLVRRAAGHHSADDRAGIKDALSRLAHANPADPEGQFWDTHREFHWAVLSPGSSGWSVRILGLLWQSAERYHRLFTLVFGSLEDAHAEHRSLAEAVEKGDPDEMHTLLIQHLHNTERTVTDGFLRASGVAPGHSE